MKISLIDQFIALLRDQNKSPHTLINYEIDLCDFHKWLEHSRLNLGNLRANDITKYLHYLSKTSQGEIPPKKWFLFWKHTPLKNLERKAPLAQNSKRRKLSALRQYLNFLHETELVRFKKTDNPVKKTLHQIKVKDIDVQKTTCIRPFEMEKILQTPLTPEKECMIRILYYGGLRLAELQQLKWKNINEEKGSIALTRKGGEYQEITFFDKKNALLALPALRQKNQDGHQGELFLFSPNGGLAPHSTRNLYDKILRILKGALNNPATPHTPHSFRKGCASWLYRETKDLLFVRDYLNHKDAKVTQTYIELL